MPAVREQQDRRAVKKSRTLSEVGLVSYYHILALVEWQNSNTACHLSFRTLVAGYQHWPQLFVPLGMFRFAAELWVVRREKWLQRLRRLGCQR